MRNSEKTKKLILEAGLKLWPNITAREIARQVGITHPAVAYHFGKDLSNAVARYAVEIGDSRVIAQLIATKHEVALNLTAACKAKHMKAAS